MRPSIKNFLVVLYCVVVVLIFMSPVLVSAQDYQLLEPSIPIDTEGLTLSSYLRGAFVIGVGAAIVLSVLRIVIGGTKYMITGSVSEKADGKEIIWGAIGGLVLALISVLILQIINPDILNFDLTKTIEEVPESVN